MGGRRRRRAHVWDMGAEAARGRGRRGARRGARDADIRLAIGLPELRDAARGAAILGSGCAPNVWVWYRMVSRRYPRPRALGFAGLLLPISAARPDPAPEPTLCVDPRPHSPGDRSGEPSQGCSYTEDRTILPEPELHCTTGSQLGSRAGYWVARPPRTVRRMP